MQESKVDAVLAADRRVPASNQRSLTMKAIVYRRYGGPEVLESVDVDRPTPGEGQVLLRVHATSINSADARTMRADPFLIRLYSGILRPKRQILGHDVAGVVEALGPGVTRFQIGDEVFGDAYQDGMGAYAELVAVRESALSAKPQELTFSEAATVPLAGITALQALRDKARIQPGQRVLIQGAGGGVGTFAVQVAKAMGAHVTAVCGPSSVDLVTSLGADEVLDYTKEDFGTREERYDVILGINGHRSLGTYRRCLQPGGTYVMVGGENRQIFHALLFGRLRFLFGGKQALTLTVNDALRQQDLEQLSGWLSRGAVRPVIDRSFALHEAADAMRYVLKGHVAGKVVLRVQGDS